MIEVLNKQLKGICTFGDVTDNSIRIVKSHCYSLQNYTYDCFRSRDEQGIPYGNTAASVLRFTVRFVQMNESKSFYQKLKSNESCIISFFFNATFTDNQELSSYDSALAMKGFIVDLKEQFQSKSQKQVELIVEFLIKSIVYVGKDHAKELIVTR